MTPLREGFTTGSCAAVCALASCLWQRDGECPDRVEIVVPEGRVYAPQVHAMEPYRCAVYKDSGDDPDITNGSEVWAEVLIGPGNGDISFAAGEGVGTITLPGLKLPVGEAAINPVPRQMIAAAVRSVFPHSAAKVTVGITGGRESAQRTFNPRLGIEGGLSILGTTGIVRPMSEEALTDTIRLEMNMRRENGAQTLGLVFGSQGETALYKLMPGLSCVQISNFVGFALDTAAELGFQRVVLAGQPGKLAKVAGGSMQTHSKYGDGRREPVAAHLALMGAPKDFLEAVMASVTLDGVIPLICDAGYAEVWNRLCKAASMYCEARVKGAIRVDTIMLDGQGNKLGAFGE